MLRTSLLIASVAAYEADSELELQPEKFSEYEPNLGLALMNI